MLRKVIAFLAAIAAAVVFQAPAIAKVSKNGAGAKQSTQSTAPRKNEHGAQGTGNWKGKRDKHQKPGPQNEKKKKSLGWIKKK